MWGSDSSCALGSQTDDDGDDDKEQLTKSFPKMNRLRGSIVRFVVDYVTVSMRSRNYRWIFYAALCSDLNLIDL